MSMLNTEQVFEAAVAAFRINGNKVLTKSSGNMIANKVLIESELANPSIVTDQDRAAAKELIEFFTYHRTMSSLVGKDSNEFTQLITTIIGVDRVPKRLIGLLQWAPRLGSDIHHAQEIRNQLAVLSYGSKFLGRPGDKVEIDYVVIHKRYNKPYQAWRYIGHDTHGNIVGFFNKLEITKPAFRIKGRIKQTETSRFAENGKTTYLSHVKEVHDSSSNL